jgi:SagB-type dehydrogenase family enzyme
MDPSVVIHIGDYFQEYTKYKYFTVPSDMSAGAPVPDAEKSAPTAAKLLDLPDGERSPSKRAEVLSELLRERRSRREYVRKPLTLKELAGLLWATQGVLETGAGYSLRTTPSAGARHPLETYLNFNRVEGQAPGLYRYLPLRRQIVQLTEGMSVAASLEAACLGQEMFTACAVSFIWTAVIRRSAWKYQQRAYRYIYLDAGHVCQNLYLACEALGLGCCAVAAYDDDAVNRVLAVDGKEEFAIYLATVGKR